MEVHMRVLHLSFLLSRRDYESRPPKLRLLAEIRAYPHTKEPGWAPEPDAPIDYCYVRPNHIPSVNAMCHDSFWPGSTLARYAPWRRPAVAQTSVCSSHRCGSIRVPAVP